MFSLTPSSTEFIRLKSALSLKSERGKAETRKK